MAKTVPMSFRLDPDLKEKLQRLADADRRSLTNYIEVVLERHVMCAIGHPVAKGTQPLADQPKIATSG